MARSVNCIESTVASLEIEDQPHGQIIPSEIAKQGSFRIFPHQLDNQPLLKQIRASGVEGAFTHIDMGNAVGEILPLKVLQDTRKKLAAVGIKPLVIESLPIPPELLYTRDGKLDERLLKNLVTSLENIQKIGVDRVMINLMGLFDWLRTNFGVGLPNCGDTSVYTHADFHSIIAEAQSTGKLSFPGWMKELQFEEIQRFANCPREVLYANIQRLFEVLLPAAEKLEMTIEVHPDDPQPPIDDKGEIGEYLGTEEIHFPRVVRNTADDYDKLFQMDNTENRVLKATACYGSWGQDPRFDSVGFTEQLIADNRLGSVHARQIVAFGDHGSLDQGYIEAAHDHTDLLVRAFELMLAKDALPPWRPDHGPKTNPTTDCDPGYEVEGRLLAFNLLRGITLSHFARRRVVGVVEGEVE